MTNIQVEVRSPTSVGVSWDSIQSLQSTDYTLYAYILYYRERGLEGVEESLTIPRTTSYVVIEDLTTDKVYQFRVAAVVQLDRELIMGFKSSAVETYLSVSACELVLSL